MKTHRFISLVCINVIVFASLLLALNWACGLYMKQLAEKKREDLPNYAANREHARDIFKDYNSVKHQYEPFVGWRMLPYLGKTLHVNAHGERVHLAPPFDSPPGKTVLFFGGSTLWGEGADDQHTIPALFNEKFPQYRVYNQGQLAYNSRQELDALISFYAREKETRADLVIFYDGVNEAAFLCPKEIADLPAHRLVPMYRQKLYVRKVQQIKELLYTNFIENVVKVIDHYTGDDKKTSPYNCHTNPEKATNIAEGLLTNWELAHEIVSKRGGQFIALLQPAAYIGNPKTNYLDLDPDLESNFVEVYKHLKQKIEERNHPWIFDLTDAFDRDEYIYIDFCHVSPNGNQIIADRISEIVNALEVRQSSIVQKNAAFNVHTSNLAP